MSAALPKDATLVELRADALTFRTRECLLPGTPVDLVLRLEGRPLALQAPVDACLVMEKDRAGYVFHCRLALGELPGPDRQLLALFINKGRGSPELAAADGR
ncbi:MAG TPA: hypothetical protein VMR21_09580 [Vicinamibacteria bacterium]|nr:hypothetical protein [Vicinamibacteria bacterium]